MRRFLFLATVILAMLGGLRSEAQDLSTFLSRPPETGAWAAYRIETKWPGHTKTERFNLAVTGHETLDGVPYVWLEAYPTDFATFKDGTLRLLLKAHPSREEALNPFLEAAVLAFQEPGSEPFKLSGGALSFMHKEAAKITVDQKKSDLPPEDAVSTKGETYHCTRMEISTVMTSSLFGRTSTITEKGTYWFSEQTPFQLVKAEIDRVQVQKGKDDRHRTVTVTLRECGTTGAATQLSKPPAREMGLLGILLH